MAKMKVAQVPKAGADFQIVERDIPEPGPGHVRIRVQACGVCHSDELVKEGAWPGLAYPRVPGHEIVGVIDEAGPGVTQWKKGQRVGVGWLGGYDGTCLACRRGDFINCANLKVAGISYDGGATRSTWLRRWKRSRRCGNRLSRRKPRRCSARA
jgi:D-arabinose 1-dehydrogenase-like Zn-dependent alcohol dehydrogenase